MASYPKVCTRWCDFQLDKSDRLLRSERIIARRDAIYSYGTHFELARPLRDSRGRIIAWLANGDRFSVTTTRHQGEIRAACEATGLPTIIVPYTALHAAGINRDSIQPLDIAPDSHNASPACADESKREAERDAMAEPTGGIIYRGASLLDEAPIVVVVTGLDGSSANSKTGAMAQTYILRADIHPVAAVRAGADASICGDCPLRPVNANGGPACYVNKGFGPAAVYRHLDGYGTMSPRQAGTIAKANGVPVRIGTYGDPGAVPARVWRQLLAGQPRHTSYTHQWSSRPSLRTFTMASVDDVVGLERAHANGWRTFRVVQGVSELQAGEIVCPASKEAGHRTTCAKCNLCDGARPNDRRASIAIVDHGPTGRKG